jgi:hypothetical protein
MDGYQFDRIARRLAVAPTRRTALRLLAGAVLGGVLTSFGIEAAAACHKGGQTCRRHGQCCSGRCHRDRCLHGECKALKPLCDAELCEVAACETDGQTGASQWVCAYTCDTGQACCKQACTGTACSGGKTFNATTCQCECPTGQTDCGGSCITPDAVCGCEQRCQYAGANYCCSINDTCCNGGCCTPPGACCANAGGNGESCYADGRCP